MSVPGRKVNSEFKVKPFTAFTEHLYNIFFKRSICDAVVSFLCCPKAEAVVVLCSYDNTLTSAFLKNTAPLVSIQLYGIKGSDIFAAFSPFNIVDCINTKMYEAVILHIAKLQLSFGRNNTCEPFCILAVPFPVTVIFAKLYNSIYFFSPLNVKYTSRPSTS